MKNPLHSLCPYFAMFPEEFVREHALEHTRRGDFIVDCFSGRGTTVLESLLIGRYAAAIDINPVAYCISAAKAELPTYEQVDERIDELDWFWRRTEEDELERERQELPPFFGRAFHASTLRQILFLRHALNWRTTRTDRFVAALVLGSLHGEMDKSPSYFSNQMPRTISTKPDYSLHYWRENELWPRKRDVFSILRARTELRYSGEMPQADGRVLLGDARKIGKRFAELAGKVRACITSPPYYDVTNFEEDQWLRLWFLGHKPQPTRGVISKDDRYRAKDPSKYWEFLASVWMGLKPLMRTSGVIVCRIGAKQIAQRTLTMRLQETVRRAFPSAALVGRPAASEIVNRQRDRFQPGTRGCLFEVDYVFSIAG